MRDLTKANEVIDEINQHEDFTLIYRVLNLTSCGLIGVSDAGLGGVGRFGYPTDQDSKTVRVCSQAGIGIFIGEKSLVSLSDRGKFNVGFSHDHKECVARAWLQKLVVWVCLWTPCSSMEIC